MYVANFGIITLRERAWTCRDGAGRTFCARYNPGRFYILSRPIEIGNDGGSNPYKIVGMDFAKRNGVIYVRYYRRGATTPFSETPSTECLGQATGKPLFYCKLDDGIHRLTSVSVEEVQEDRVSRDSRIIPLRDTLNIKKGELHIRVHQSPSNGEFIGKFKETGGDAPH